MDKIDVTIQIGAAFKSLSEGKITAEKATKRINSILTEFGEQYRIDNINNPFIDSEGYELNENMERTSCCGDVLDPDIMMCPSCKEHC